MALELIKRAAEFAQAAAASHENGTSVSVLVTVQLPKGTLEYATKLLAQEDWTITPSHDKQELYARPAGQKPMALDRVSICLSPAKQVRAESRPPHPEVARWLAGQPGRAAA